MGLGSGIRDPGSGKNLFRIPDPDPQHCYSAVYWIPINSMVSLNQDFAALGTLHDGLFSKWKERAYASTPKINIFSSLFLAQFCCP
jgi:hypothetical protein